MGSFSRIAAQAALLTAAVMAAQPAAYAQSAPNAGTAKSAARVTFVPCSAAALTSAVTQANALGGVLRLAAHCTYGIPAPLNITGNVGLIGGPATTVRPGIPGFRVINNSGTLRVRGVFIFGGSPADNGGGILNTGTLVLSYVTVRGNSAGGGGNGGGLANTGNAFISHSVFTGNSATGNGGGIDNALVGFPTGTLTLFASLLTGNSAPNLGGGINTESGGRTRIVQSTISGNLEPGPVFGGGGVGNNAGGTTSIFRTLITLNQTAATGGGVKNLDPDPNTVVIRRSHVVRNVPDSCAPVISGCGD